MKRRITALICASMLLTGCAGTVPESASTAQSTETAEPVTSSTAQTTEAVTTAAVTTAPAETTTTTTAPSIKTPMVNISADGAGDFASSRSLMFGDSGEVFANVGIYEELVTDEGVRFRETNCIFRFKESGAELLESDGSPHFLGEHDGTVFCYAYRGENIIYGFLRDGTFEQLKTDGSGHLEEPLCADGRAYLLHDGDKGTDVFRISFDGSCEKLCMMPDVHSVQDWLISDGRIYFDTYDPDLAKKFAYKYGWYDLDTGECQTFLEGGVGEICGGYMYYSEKYCFFRERENGIYRVPKDGGDPEYICGGENFCGIYRGDVLYTAWDNASSEYSELGIIYRIGHGRDSVFFDANEYFGAGSGYTIKNVLIKDGRVFADIGSHHADRYILELDENGDVINTLFEYEAPEDLHIAPHN